MTLILGFIAAHMSFLWDEARYRIASSEVSTSNGGDALLLVESDTLRLRFVCDRRQLLLDLRPTAGVGKEEEWFSVDLIRRLFLGKPESSGLLDASYASFLGEHLSQIERSFTASNWPATRAELKKLEIMRSKEMFG